MNTDVNKSFASQHAKYTQVKVSVEPQIANAFKGACAAAGVSMAAELSRFMADYSNSQIRHKAAPDYTTRRRRRTAINSIVAQLKQIKAFEEKCRDNTPENFQSNDIYDSYEGAISSIEDAVDNLDEFWMVL